MSGPKCDQSNFVLQNYDQRSPPFKFQADISLAANAVTCAFTSLYCFDQGCNNAPKPRRFVH